MYQKSCGVNKLSLILAVSDLEFHFCHNFQKVQGYWIKVLDLVSAQNVEVSMIWEVWRSCQGHFYTNAVGNPIKFFDKLTKGTLTCKHKILT